MLKPFKIQLSAVGVERVEIDGEDVTPAVVGVTVQSRPNEVTHVYLEAHSDAELHGEAVVEWMREAAPGQAIAAWLRQLDREAIEQHVLNSGDLATNYTSALFDYLISLVDHG